MENFLTTMGMRQVFYNLDLGEEEIQIFIKHNEILQEFMKEVVVPIDLVNPEITLKTSLEK